MNQPLRRQAFLSFLLFVFSFTVVVTFFLFVNGCCGLRHSCERWLTLLDNLCSFISRVSHYIQAIRQLFAFITFCCSGGISSSYSNAKQTIYEGFRVKLCVFDTT
jgi:hypothetical protein